jgi:hypothetical protein
MLERLQAPTRIGSKWTVAEMCDLVRNLTLSYDGGTLQVHEIRSYLNVCISSITEMGANTGNLGYYGVHGTGVADAVDPTTYIDLSSPTNLYTNLPLPETVGGAMFTPDQPINTHTMHASNIRHQTDDDLVVDGNGNPYQGLFAETDLYDGITSAEFYREYYIPSAVLEDIISVTVRFNNTGVETRRGEPKYALTKTSMDELLFHERRDNTLAQHGYWTYFGGRIYLYLGNQLLDAYYPDTNYATVLLNCSFDVFALRKPYLDNMLPTDQKNSGYFKHIDLPDKDIRTLAIMLQKMVLEKLGRPLSAELESVLAQGLSQIAGSRAVRSQQMAQQRMKTEQGFTTR